MKPSAFAYARPTTLGEALDVLADAAPDAKVLAGGQSLVPILSMRLAAPHTLVDINRLHELAFVRVEHGGVRVGATARQADVERAEHAGREVPLLLQAIRFVAHPTIRNRGTVVGSLVHADPSAELPAVLALLGGSVEVASTATRRTVAAGDFFVGPLESVVKAGELATSAWFPAPPPRSGTAFVEVARRHGDYAVCGVAALVSLDNDGRVERARTAYVSVAATPLVLDLTDAVRGSRHDSADWAAAGRMAYDQTKPDGDIHASAAYRRRLVEVLSARAVRDAAGRAA